MHSGSQRDMWLPFLLKVLGALGSVDMLDLVTGDQMQHIFTARPDMVEEYGRVGAPTLDPA